MGVIVEDSEETSEEHPEGIRTDSPEVASEGVVLVVHVVAMGAVAMEMVVAIEEASVEPPGDVVVAAMVDMTVASRRGGEFPLLLLSVLESDIKVSKYKMLRVGGVTT